MRNFIQTTTVAAGAVIAASPAWAAGGGISLKNTDFVVLLGLLVFIGILLYFKVPGMIGKMLDSRAEGIQAELNEARALRDEAQSLLASYERKQREVQEQADRIVEAAKEEAKAAADVDQSIAVAIAAARSVIADKMSASEGNNLIDAGIAEVDAKLH